MSKNDFAISNSNFFVLEAIFGRSSAYSAEVRPKIFGLVRRRRSTIPASAEYYNLTFSPSLQVLFNPLIPTAAIWVEL